MVKEKKRKRAQDSDESSVLSLINKHMERCGFSESCFEKVISRSKIEPNSELTDLLGSSKWTGLSYCWKTKRCDVIPRHASQREEDCWSWALLRGQNTALALSGKSKPRLNLKKLKEGVTRRYQNEEGGLEDISYAREFMVGEGYVEDMIVYRRPKVEDADFESLIQTLLTEKPVPVNLEILPSYHLYEGTGVFVPSELDLRRRENEIFDQHMVLLISYETKLHNGQMVECWGFLDSKGRKWGDGGYGYLARRKRIISQVVDLKIGSEDVAEILE